MEILTPKEMNKEELEFLKENNAIEGVSDDVSLKQARKAWEYLKTKDILTVGVVLKTHKILMLHSNLYPNEKGYFRNCEVRIGNRYGLNYALVPTHMLQWCQQMNLALKEKEPDHIKLHVIYEKIHGFIDGNGRSGRLLMNWLRVQRGEELIIFMDVEKYEKYYPLFMD